MTFPGLNATLTLGAAIADRAQAQGERVAYTLLSADQAPQQLTYRELHQGALRYAAYLRANAIDPGDTVLLAGQHNLALLIAFVGALYAGAVPAIFPYLERYSNTDIYLRRLSDRATAHQLRAVLITAPLQPRLATQLAGTNRLALALDPLGAEAANISAWCNQAQAAFAIDTRSATTPGYLQFSSGTTGEAKGVVVSHGAALRYVAALAQFIDAQTTDVLVGWPPFHHDLGLVCYLLFPLLTGMHVVTMAPDFWVRRPHILLRAIHEYRGTLSLSPNFAFAHILRVVRDDDIAGVDLSTLRWIGIGAEMIQPSTVQQFQSRFLAYGLPPNVVTATYGMAECVLVPIIGHLGQGIVSDPVSPRRLVEEHQAQMLAVGDAEASAIASCGFPLNDVTITIVDDAGQPLPERQVGEIVLRCPFLFDGYLQQPDLTAQTLRADSLYTGDLGYCADGQLFVVGRKKDLMITAGKNIYPESIEQLALAELGEVAGRAAAFGVRDERLGTELPVLVCEVRGRVDDDRQHQYSQQLRWRVQQELGVALADMRLVRRGWLVSTTSGKVARAASREKYLANGFGPQPLGVLPPDLLQRTPAEIEAALGLFFGDAVGGVALAATTNLFEAGVSSLLLAQSVAKLEQMYACAIPIERFVQKPTIAQLAQLLCNTQPTPAIKAHLPDLPRLRQPYSKNRWLNYFFNEGFRVQQLTLPYALGLRLQRAWLKQPWVQERFFRKPLMLVKYRASQVGEPKLEEAILRSLMCNIWSFWRLHHLQQPATFARWCTVQSTDVAWPPKQAGRGVIYALSHTPDSYCFPLALQQQGITPSIIAWERVPGLAPQQVQTMQVYQAQQTLRQGGVVIIYADGTFGSGGITVNFWGGQRNFRPGVAALAEATGAVVLPVFSSFATTGEITFKITAPLVAQGNTPESRIESLLLHYADTLRAQWPQLYSNFWWHFLR